jgi:hypothetical protein
MTVSLLTADLANVSSVFESDGTSKETAVSPEIRHVALSMLPKPGTSTES